MALNNSKKKNSRVIQKALEYCSPCNFIVAGLYTSDETYPANNHRLLIWNLRSIG